MKTLLGIMSAGCTLFFVQPVSAQTLVVTLKTCSEIPTKSDPSIVTRTIIDARSECGRGHPVKIEVVDLHFGFRTATKSVQNVPVETRRGSPWERNIYATHKPCRLTYRHENGGYEGIMIEWIIPKGERCNGRPDGSYYRVYTWDNRVCIRPSGGCIAVSDLTAEGQHRFREVLQYAFAQLVAMH